MLFVLTDCGIIIYLPVARNHELFEMRSKSPAYKIQIGIFLTNVIYIGRYSFRPKITFRGNITCTYEVRVFRFRELQPGGR